MPLRGEICSEVETRTREGAAVARAKGRLRGKQPKISASHRRHLLTLHRAGEHTQAELAQVFNVSRTTVYREVRRGSGLPPTV